ncbi:MAG: formyltransferase family protein [Verrucomicrobia bacterium]|nr:formyltransferase family protein [Verrucomicrobiota bacterium]
MKAPTKIVVLAGHRRSLPSMILVDALHQLGPAAVDVVAVISVFELNWQRLQLWRRRFGPQLLRRVASELGIRRTGAFTAERAIYERRLQAQGSRPRNLADQCRRLHIPYHVVPEINSSRCLELLRRLAPTRGIYSGAGILRQPLIDSIPDGVLNLHCGPLPHVRGLNGVEWSLYLGLVPEVTLHIIDAGIDTGPILARQTVPVQPGDTLDTLRGKTVLAGIDLLTAKLPTVDQCPQLPNPREQGCQYYAMAPEQKELVTAWLAAGRTPVQSAEMADPNDGRPAIYRQTVPGSTQAR